jgi:signal recognition particle subunit SRP9
MYIEDFEAFYHQAAELFKARPLDTRYVVKYRHSEGKLVMKVTDNRTVRACYNIKCS